MFRKVEEKQRVDDILKGLEGAKLKSAEEYYKFLIIESWDAVHKYYSFGRIELLEYFLSTDKEPSTLARIVWLENLKAMILQHIYRLSPYIDDGTLEKILNWVNEINPNDENVYYEIGKVIIAINRIMDSLNLIDVKIPQRPDFNTIIDSFRKKFGKKI